MSQKIPNSRFSHLTEREVRTLKLDQEYDVAAQRRERAVQVQLDQGLSPEGKAKPADGRIE